MIAILGERTFQGYLEPLDDVRKKAIHGKVPKDLPPAPAFPAGLNQPQQAPQVAQAQTRKRKSPTNTQQTVVPEPKTKAAKSASGSSPKGTASTGSRAATGVARNPRNTRNQAPPKTTGGSPPVQKENSPTGRTAKPAEPVKSNGDARRQSNEGCMLFTFLLSYSF
jgi:hypothetical protein